jgi:hypothetical protein
VSDTFSAHEDDRWRPAWDDTPDETDRDLKPTPRTPPTGGAPPRFLAIAQDAISRLDALVGAAATPVREGMMARMAFREASGWLAFASVPVSALDLALMAGRLKGWFDQSTRDALDMVNDLVAGRAVVTAADDWLGEGRELLVLPKAIVPPFWAAYASLGAGTAIDGWPRLRSDVARGVGAARWPATFLHLTAESALMALRERSGLQVVREKGRGLAPADARSRLAAVVDELVRAPIVTPAGVAAALRITPQAVTSILRKLQTAGLAREVTGRESFRAFAAKL